MSDNQNSYFTPEADDPSTPLAYLRLGSYLGSGSAEDGYIDSKFTPGSGIYLMTNAELTVDGGNDIVVSAGNGMTVDGDKAISAVVSGETSVRAMTTGFGASSSPPTDDINMTLEAENGVTLHAETGIEITCETLRYVVDQNYTSSFSSSSTSHYKTNTTFTLGGSTSASLLNSSEVSVARFSPYLQAAFFSMLSFTNKGFAGGAAAFENANFGIKAFLIGLMLPIAGAESSATGAGNSNSLVNSEDEALGGSQSGALSENNGTAVNTVAVSSN